MRTMGLFVNFQRSLALGTLFINEKPQIGHISLAAGILLLSIASAFLWHSRRVYNKKLPSYKEIPSTILSHMATKKELESLSPDVVVIGSGIGSLASACVLAKAGYKVVVFEQHYIAGGSTHMFKRDHDFEFDVGVHYVGGCLDRCWSPFRILFDFLSDGKLEWSRMSENYDVTYNYTTGERIEISGDPKRNRKTLLMHFPHLQASALDAYYRKCRLARFVGIIYFAFKCFPPTVLKFVWNIGFGGIFRKVCLRTTMEVMKEECGLPDDVIGAILYSYGDYGTPPSQSPFFIQAFMESHYHGGAYFPKGGSTSIAKTLVAAILRQGGMVYAKTPVKRILTKKDWKGRHVAIGACVGECEVNVLAKKGVISGAGFMKTFEVDVTRGHSPLLDDQRASASQLALIHNKDVQQAFKPSHAFFYLFVGLDGTDKELCLPGQNIWHVKNWEHDKSLERLLNAKNLDEALMEPPPLVFLSNESAKDPDFAKRHPGKATVTLIAWTNPDWFRKWEETQHGHRGEEYESMKKKMKETLLNVLYLHFPLTKGRVRVAELGTPLTADKYLGRANGEIYNLDHNVSRFETLGAQLALHPQTTVKNLYLAGQDATAVSIEGASMSGFFAATRLSSYTMIFICIPIALSCIPGLFWL